MFNVCAFLIPFRDLLLSVALGQVLSLLICGIGLTSKYLSEDFHANTPVFQSFLNYILLFLVYTTTLAVRQGKCPSLKHITLLCKTVRIKLLQKNNKKVIFNCDLDTYPINIHNIFILPSNTYWINKKKTHRPSVTKNELVDS